MTATTLGASESFNEKNAWVRAHEALSRLARERAAADAEEGRCLLAALRSAVHVHEALEELPALARALEAGEVNWSAVRELTRVAVSETESDWLEVARGKTVHQLEALVAGTSPGDKPSSAGQPEARRHVLRFEVSPETLGLFREPGASSGEAVLRSMTTPR
jgi:hypothetical protein